LILASKSTMMIHFPYPYGFLILYGSTEINDMIMITIISTAYGVNLASRLLDKILYVVDKSDITL